MKKLLFTLLVVLLSLNLLSQNVSMGLASYNKEVGSGNDIFFNFGINFSNYFIEYQGNFTSGIGEELNFNSEYTYKLNKKSIDIVNIGYKFNIYDDKEDVKIYLSPKIGLHNSREIYQDNLGFQTYYYSTPQQDINYGIGLDFMVYDKYGCRISKSKYTNMELTFIFKLF